MKFCENTDKHTHTHTHTNRHGHYNTSPSPYGGRGNNLDDVGKHTWASEIKLLLYRYGFGHVWVSQSVGNIDVFLSVFKEGGGGGGEGAQSQILKKIDQNIFS